MGRVGLTIALGPIVLLGRGASRSLWGRRQVGRGSSRNVFCHSEKQSNTAIIQRDDRRGENDAVDDRRGKKSLVESCRRYDGWRLEQ